MSQHKDKSAQRCDIFFPALLRFSLGIDEKFPYRPTVKEWNLLYALARKQSLVGVTYDGVARLSEDYFTVPSSHEADAQTYLPEQLTMQWANNAEVIAGLNEQENRKAAQLTTLFEQRGHHTVILKGQANARLYPNPLSRQPGDIDIYVDGGRDGVKATLNSLGMMGSDVTDTPYHFHLPPDEDGIEVEVHFQLSSGNLNPITNQRLQTYLALRLADSTDLCSSGFRVPSTIFALAMQLAHISRHVMEGGVGLRQIIDYYYLLLTSTDDDRRQLESKLKELGLRHVARALMWVLAEMLHLPKNLMLVSPDRWRGRWLLQRVLYGGNFGWYVKPRHMYGTWNRFFNDRCHTLAMLWFCPEENHRLVGEELHYWSNLFLTIPKRIKYRKLSFINNQELL